MTARRKGERTAKVMRVYRAAMSYYAASIAPSTLTNLRAFGLADKEFHRACAAARTTGKRGMGK